MLGSAMKTHDELVKFLAKDSIAFEQQVLATKLTTLACGGPIALLIRPNSVAELQSTLKELFTIHAPYRVIGNGSNLLISDNGIGDEVVIQLGKRFKTVEPIASGTGVFQIGGSVSMPTLARQCATDGYAGLEFAAGIPASLGGAVHMNAGAHGSEISSVIQSVLLCDTTGSVHQIDAREIRFVYRHCELPMKGVVFGATIRLTAGSSESIQAALQHNLSERKKYQPLQFPSCGAVFKNPDGARGSAGALIETVGLKGATIGAAQISTMHANWIVNPSKTARSSDVHALIELAKTTVKDQKDIELHPEVQRWGAF